MPPRSRQIREHLGLETSERVIPTASMWPWIRPGDAIRFRRATRPARPGEIWVARRGPIHLVHRVLWTRADGAALFKGDYTLRPDGWIPKADLFGPVEAIRHGRWHPTNRPSDRLLGFFTSGMGTLLCGARAAAKHLSRRLARASALPFAR